MRTLNHYLDHLEIAFATLPYSEGKWFSRDTSRVEAALGVGIAEKYVGDLKRKRPNRELLWPGGRRDDTIVGRHSVKTIQGPIEICHGGDYVPEEISAINGYPQNQT